MRKKDVLLLQSVLCVHCLCHIDFWMGRRVGVSPINDNLMKPDKLMFRASGFF